MRGEQRHHAFNFLDPFSWQRNKIPSHINYTHIFILCVQESTTIISNLMTLKSVEPQQYRAVALINVLFCSECGNVGTRDQYGIFFTEKATSRLGKQCPNECINNSRWKAGTSSSTDPVLRFHSLKRTCFLSM